VSASTATTHASAGAIVDRFERALARGKLESCVSALEEARVARPRDASARRVARALAPHHRGFLSACAAARPPRTDLAARYAAALAPNARLYAAALTTCARAGDFAGAARVFALYEARGVKADVFAYSGIISAAGKAGDLASARALLANAVAHLGDACDVGVYNAFVDACARGGDVAAARAACAAMKARGPAARCAPNARTYNSVITAAARARDLPAAKAALAEMERARPRVEPTDRTFGAALAAAAAEEVQSAENVRWALATYDRFVSDPAFLSAYRRNNHAASSVLTVLARGVAAGAWPAEDAVRRAGEITGALVAGAAGHERGEGEETAEATRGAEKTSLPPRGGRASNLRNSAPNAAVWSAHMSVCARAGRAREALDALALMRACGVALDAYTLGVGAHGVSGAAARRRARRTARRRRRRLFAEDPLLILAGDVLPDTTEASDATGVVSAFSFSTRAAASPEALEALAAFETAPAAVSGTVAVRNAAIALYAAAGRTDRAFALYESMRRSPRGSGEAAPGGNERRGDAESGDSPDSVPTRLKNESSSVPGERAFRREALPDDARQSSSPDTITYNTLISACASSDTPARAEALHRDMVAAGVPRSGRTYVGLMTAAARAAEPGARAAAAARVFALAEADATTEPANAFIYTALIDAQVKGFDPDAAFETFERMKRAGVAPTVVTFGCLLNACCAPRADPNAKSSNAKSISTSLDDANAHVSVSRAYDLLSQMSLYGVCPNDRCQNALVRAVAEAGRVDDALDEVKKIARGGGRFERATLEGVVLALCRKGYAERALRIVGWMDVRGFVPGRAAYRALVRACSKEGSVTTAWRVHVDGVEKAGYRPDRAAASALILALCRAAASSGLDSSDARVMTRRAVEVFETAIREGVALEGEDDDVDFTTVGAGDAPAGQYCPVRPPPRSGERERERERAFVSERQKKRFAGCRLDPRGGARAGRRGGAMRRPAVRHVPVPERGRRKRAAAARRGGRRRRAGPEPRGFARRRPRRGVRGAHRDVLPRGRRGRRAGGFRPAQVAGRPRRQGDACVPGERLPPQPRAGVARLRRVRADARAVGEEKGARRRRGVGGGGETHVAPRARVGVARAARAGAGGEARGRYAVKTVVATNGTRRYYVPYERRASFFPSKRV
jgi:pentatricopeptide repeat protein